MGGHNLKTLEGIGAYLGVVPLGIGIKDSEDDEANRLYKYYNVRFTLKEY